MKSLPTLFLALLAPFAFAWSVSAGATQNCQNGKTLYQKTNAAVPTSCSNSSCHGAGVNLHNIQHAAGNPGAIDMALDGTGSNAEMVALDLRNNLPLTASDIDDLATYIFYATVSQPCPAAAPNVSANPTSLSFGNVNVGATSATQIVTVTNAGPGNATGLTYGNTNAAEFLATKTCGASISAGATCTITLSYKPSAAGADSASYTITGTGVNVSIALSGNGGAAPAANLQASPPVLSFGNITVGQTSAAIAVTVSNSGGAAASSVTLNNSNAAEFLVIGNTCGTTINAGASCALNVAYAPSATGTDNATLTLNYGGGGALSISVSGTGVNGTPPPIGQLSLPGTVTMTNQNVGTVSAPRAVTVTNVGNAAVAVTAITSSNAAEFPVSGSTCTTVNAGASCTFNITFQPSAAGARTATITFASNGAGNPQTIAVTGTGASVAGPPTATAVEYYHAVFDHYFMTAIADEITKLDNGTFVGWVRTGKSFKINTSTAAGLNPVCRFFSTAFAPKSSHFYTPLPAECTAVKANPNWMFEAEVFFIAVPAIDGTCAAGTIPVYRVYNNGQGAAPNHRYTTDLAVRSAMLAFGWVPEGYGPIGVIMCAPP